MAEKRGRGRARGAAEEEVEIIEVPAPGGSPWGSKLARLQLRRRWELASVLNFLHVFQPLIRSDLKVSAEEIETALISPNNTLAQLHIALLKGIPPVNKNLTETDAWVTVVCKKLNVWWPWVAEGENPLKADHGSEVVRYKELDPTTRLLILKALCEVRAEQDDVLRYITDALKSGTNVTTFRKEKIGSADNGTTYWYDGDPIIGHRLYKGILKVEVNQKLKGKVRLTQPRVDFQWETIATNLEEFREVSQNLSSSKNMGEVSVAQLVRSDIVPVLEELQKKKDRALKRQQREALLLDGVLNSNRIGLRCSRRERRPVNYTFDDYDRIINEAIHVSKRYKTDEFHEDTSRQMNGGLHSVVENSDLDEAVHVNDYDDKDQDNAGEDGDDEDDDYNEKDDDCKDISSDEDGYQDDFDNENEHIRGRSSQEPAQNVKDLRSHVVLRLRRSGRTAGGTNHSNVRANGGTSAHAEMKKRLRERPIRNADYSSHVVPDSEDDCDSGDDKLTETNSGTEELSAATTNSDDE